MRRDATGLPATRFTTSGAVGGATIRPCTGAPFFTDGGTMRLVSVLPSPPAPPAPAIAPGGIIGMPPTPPLGAPAESDGAAETGDAVCADAGTVPAEGVGGGPSCEAGVVLARPAPAPPPAPAKPAAPPAAPPANPAASPGIAPAADAAPPAPLPAAPITPCMTCIPCCGICVASWVNGCMAPVKELVRPWPMLVAPCKSWVNWDIGSLPLPPTPARLLAELCSVAGNCDVA